jgi:hypothetical protein
MAASTVSLRRLRILEQALRGYVYNARRNGMGGWPDIVEATSMLTEVRVERDALTVDVRRSDLLFASTSDMPAGLVCASEEITSAAAARLLGFKHGRHLRRVAASASPPVEPCFRQRGKPTLWRRPDIDRLDAARRAA